MPPRTRQQVYDIKLLKDSKLIDHTSGGLSLFSTPNYSFGSDWWVVPAGVRLPLEFTLSKDLTDGVFRGHYTIRAMKDMSESTWKRLLIKWADEHAVHINEYKKANNNV